MTSTQKPESQRVLSRELGAPIERAEMEALKGGQTAYPCGDDLSRVTSYAHHQTDITVADCA